MAEISQPDAAQLIAIDYLARGGTKTQAARMAGVDESTLWRWRQQPGFKAKLQEVVCDILDRGRLLRQSNWLMADQLIHETMADESLDRRDRLYAASLAQRTLPQVLKLSGEEDDLSAVKPIDEARVALAKASLGLIERRTKHKHEKPKPDA